MQRKRFVLMIATLSFVMLGLGLFGYPPISRYVILDLKLSHTESGYITSIFALTFALMQVPGGYLADRFGGAKTLMIFASVVGISPFIFIIGDSFVMALIFRALAGGACGVTFPSAVRVISSWFSEKEVDSAMSVFGLGYGLSQIVSSAFLPLLVLAGDWRPALIFTALFSLLVMALAILPARWPSPIESSVVGVRVDVRGLFTRNMFALTLPNLASLAVVVGIFAWTPAFLTSILHLSDEFAGVILGSIGVANMLGAYAGGITNKWLGKRRTITLSMLLMTGFAVLLGTANSGLVAAIWISGIGFSGMLYFAADFGLIPYAAKQGRSVAGISFGVFNMLSNIGTFVSPIIVGYILDLTGNFFLGFAAVGCIGLLGVLGAAILRTD
ncbi:MAG TPA: MFS transporter [Candidatus Acidoferrales bacterium]|nr:MFS transporter [Candidatus Acidoferrales bacterium]